MLSRCDARSRRHVLSGDYVPPDRDQLSTWRVRQAVGHLIEIGSFRQRVGISWIVPEVGTHVVGWPVA